MSNARERILQRVSDALGQRRGAIVPPAASRRPAPADLLANFRERLTAVAGEILDHDATQPLVDTIAFRLRQAGARTVAFGGGAAMRQLAAELTQRGFTVLAADAATEAIAQADAGVTEAQWGISETGTIVLDDEAARGRRASLLPPLHLAVLDKRSILPTLDDAIDRAAASGRLPHALTLVTGPSRTADIELQLVVGVHGPQELVVVLR